MSLYNTANVLRVLEVREFGAQTCPPAQKFDRCTIVQLPTSLRIS